MFIYSIKAATVKFIGVLVLAATILTLLVVFVPSYDSAYASSDSKISYSGIENNEDRINFLKHHRTPSFIFLKHLPWLFDTTFEVL